MTPEKCSGDSARDDDGFTGAQVNDDGAAELDSNKKDRDLIVEFGPDFDEDMSYVDLLDMWTY